MYIKRRVPWMNRPFLLTIAFAVLAFNANTAWANSDESFPIWWEIVKWLLSPLAILISACVAGCIANRTIKENKKNQQRLTTIKYMLRLSWDSDYTEVRKKFLKLKAAKINFAKIAEDYHILLDKKNSKAGIKLDDEEQATIDNHEIIRKILNEYEFMAIAIKTGSYDDDIIKTNIKQTVLSDLRTCGAFIGTTRKKLNAKNEYITLDTIYNECCDLYKKWSGNGLETLS